MKFLAGLQSLRRRRQGVISATTFSALTALVVTGAIVYPGFKTADVDLNDGGVWVTNKSQNLVGHLNYQSKVLDGGFLANSAKFDVKQHASTVYMENNAHSTLNPVDVAKVALGNEQQLPANADVSLGQDTIAITKPKTGEVWVTTNESLSSFSAEATDPTLKASPGSAAAVSDEDVVFVADTGAGEITEIEVDAEGQVVREETTGVDGLAGAQDIQLAAVGGEPVVFDGATSTLYLPGGTVKLDAGQDARLQQSGPESDFVALATGRGLIKQPLDGSDATTVPLDAQGDPARPVQMGGCVHSAWSGAGLYLRDCASNGNDQKTTIPKIAGDAELSFRVNRDVVVLNDLISGNIWLVNENMKLVNNWDDIIPPPDKSDEEEEDSADDNPIDTLPDRTKKNRPPEAKDDAYGVRPGRTTLLPILDNDSDPDGDLLTASLVGDAPDVGKLQKIYDGTGMQVVVPEDAKKGTYSFTYEADDGRGGTDQATVQLVVRGPDSNKPPERKRETRILLEQGKTISQNVLSDWIDPDGDDLFLVDAQATTKGDQVRFRPDGRITFQDIGTTFGEKEVKITVSDGRSTTEGTVTMDVRPPGALPPVANPDHVSTSVGQEVMIAPLKNDLDPNGGSLRLARVDPENNVEFNANYDAGTLTVESSTPGTYYLKYLVTNDPASSTGLIRVDVKADNSEGAPVAVRDVGLLPSEGDVLVDVLGNDTDPNGGVLVVQSVDVPKDSGLNVAILNHNILRITDSHGLKGNVSIEYTVSNGTSSSTGEVSVIPVPPPATLEPPQATADEATVRAGDVVTIDVLDNDTHPNGDELSLDPKLVQGIDPKHGRLFVAQDKLRFIAGPKAKTVHAIYNVVDSAGQKDSAQVTINIRAKDPERNSRPDPENLTGRVLAGSSIRIPVPLNGIDADGDSVQLVGIESAPKQGTALVGSNYIDYVAAGNGSGTDSFTYKVRDRMGAVSTGTVLVGIAPKPETNQKPVAIDDSVKIRPGKRVSMDVLRNDSDPDGDAIALVKDDLSADKVMKAKVKKDTVLATAPGQEGIATVRYGIADERGAKASAVVRLDVDKNAPLHRPIARDDRVTTAETLGKTAVSVPVLENDQDPDGVTEDLKISFPDNNPTASVKNNEALIELKPGPQIIPYTVTDIDGGKATAVIWVPGVGDQLPTLKDHKPIKVDAGETIELNLEELVQVREGRSPRITVAESVSGIGNSNEDMVVDEQTLRYTAGEDYGGPGSVTFEVTDGSGPDDPDGNKATLTVLTEVIPDPETNTPPTFSSSTMEVAEAEDGQSLDLAQLAKDPDKRDRDDLEFAIEGGIPAGYEASLDGSVLHVRAKDGTDAGYVGDINLSVTDGRSDPVTASVTVTTTASNRPVPVANNDVVSDAVQGETETVNVLANDVNPYEDTPLKIVEATVETGEGTASISGDSVAVTPSSDFVGTMVVRYTIADKTEDPGRFAQAKVKLTVKGAPDVPGTPSVEEVRDQTVVLSWRPPSNNGSPITNYTVKGTHGVSQDCASTTCTISGLTNDTIYRFTVTATNEVGTSDPSPQSAEARPDAKPEQPQPPQLKFGDGELKVSWKTPPTPGSPVHSFNLRISPAPPGGGATKTGVTGNSLTWGGLQNGVPYKVQVQAVNDAPDPSKWSAYSASEIPAGKPSVPQAPSTQRLKPVGDRTQLQVNWNAPATNGDPVEHYTLKVLRGGSVQRTMEVQGTSQAITVPNAEANYTFTVSATNKAGTSAQSAPSAPRRAFGKPGTVKGVSATPANTGGSGRAITVKFNQLTAAQRNGAKASEIRYRATFSDGRTMGITSGETVGGFSNGTRHSVRITAISSSNGASYTGSASAAASASPYGSPGTPSASATNGSEGETSIRVRWSGPNRNTHDVARVQIKIDGGGWHNAGFSGSRTVGNGYDQKHTLKVRSCNSRDNCNVVSASGTTGAEPPPPPPDPPGPWTTGVVNTNVRTCMEKYGEWDNFDGNADPNNCYGDHWAYPSGNSRDMPASSITSKCYYMSSGIPWYLQSSGNRSRNDGHIIKGIHTEFGTSPPKGMDPC
ncbi:Ig-like domain-containing protein [Arthrobacter castelli]|uniref:Ig-like domain-containing protein n=1 Tax=Arthrobacter castelli TaxID=271431 RepID=UPI00041B4187|nr:Ig-like domain-containing protein [Arthrobacter castelli]